MTTIQEALELALQFHRAGRFAEADAVYARVLEAAPGHHDALHLRGLVRLRTGDPQGAVHLIGRALAQEPALAHAHFNLGNVLAALGRRAEAARRHAACCRLDPGFAAAPSALAEGLTALGRRDDALAALARVLVLEPANAAAALAAGRLLTGVDRLAEATRLLTRAARLEPGNAIAQDELARVLEALRVWDAAGDALTAAARLRPGDAALRRRQGLALRNANRDAEAAEAFRTLAASGDAEGWYQLGLIERQGGRLEEAVAAFDASLAGAPHHGPAHFHRGLALALLGRRDGAFPDPHGLGPAHAGRAAALATEGRLKDACAHYHEALLFRPGLDDARRGLDAVLAERRRRCDAGVRDGTLAPKTHTDEWGNVELYEAMLRYNEALAEDPRLAGIPAAASPATQPRVFDTFTFYNELDLLELRLEELHPVVDAFVVVEAPWTFQDRPKPLVFAENRARFARFADKIVHVVAEGRAGPSAWDREKHQRDAILTGLAGRAGPDDVVFLGDVDEIPRRATVTRIRNDALLASRLNRLSVDYYCGFLDFRCTYKWHKPMALPYRLLERLGPDRARFLAIAKYGTLLYDTGWHFSWLGGIEKAIAKLNSYAHSEYTRLAEDAGPERIREALRSGKGIFALMDADHGYAGEFAPVPLDAGFPEAVRADPERWRRLGWFYPG